MLGKLVVGEIAVGEVVTGEIVFGKLRWGNDLTPKKQFFRVKLRFRILLDSLDFLNFGLHRAESWLKIILRKITALGIVNLS